jgi:hypothetical protein
MNQFKLNTLMVGATILLFLLALAINEMLFTRLEFAPGINWIYLPAGVRLLCTLLFAQAGAIGLLLVSWGVSFLLFFPNDPVRAFAGGILSSASPYLVYLGMRRYLGLDAALTRLTTARLLACSLAFSLASPLLHHLWFALYEGKTDLVPSFLAMATGDFCGTITVLYVAKFLLARMGPQRR